MKVITEAKVAIARYAGVGRSVRRRRVRLDGASASSSARGRHGWSLRIRPSRTNTLDRRTQLLLAGQLLLTGQRITADEMTVEV